MKLIDTRNQIRTVAERWKNLFFRKGAWASYVHNPAEQIYHKLISLDPEVATEAQVAFIIGNASWIGQTCSECEKHRAVIEVGQPPDYESHTAYLCTTCLAKAYDLVFPSLTFKGIKTTFDKHDNMISRTPIELIDGADF